MEKNLEKKFERKSGRPVGSEVRKNIVDILYTFGHLHGYELYKVYVDIFPQVTMRLIYYHLKKGVATEEFKILRIDKKKGKFSWGEETQHIVYGLGPKASALENPRIKEYALRKRVIKNVIMYRVKKGAEKE